MAAIALTGTIMTACSNEDVPTATEQLAQSRTFTVTTTLSPRNGVTRSTMTDNGDGSISSEWQVNDQIFVGYRNTSDAIVKTIATVTAVHPSTKAATITMTLTDPKDGSIISFGYPLSYWNETKKLITDQIGTLADINNNFAAIGGDGKLTVSESDVTLSAVTMTPYICIWKFSFTDGINDITNDITKLVIDLPDDNPNDAITYAVTPSSQNTIYVAMYGGINAKPICITAQTATGVYRKAAASVTLNAGLTYTTTNFALKKVEVGKVLGANGNIYDTVGDAGLAAALITYVGNDAENSASNTAYHHGLALALSDASTGAEWCDQWAETCLATQYSTSTDAKTDMAGIANTDALIGHKTHTHAAADAVIYYNGGTHPTGTSAWFLPSAGQWDKMATAAGSYATLKTNASLKSGFYWSSTERSTNWAWCYTFTDDGWRSNGKDDSNYVRLALAF